MALKERIEADLKTAMLARDSFLVETLRGLKSVILLQEVAEGKRDEGLDDTVVEGLLAKEAKKRDESAVLFEQGGNQASADKERQEKEVIAQYLPKQLSEDDIRALVQQAIADTGAASMQDMGKVIGAVKAKAGNSADGSLVAKIVKEILQA